MRKAHNSGDLSTRLPTLREVFRTFHVNDGSSLPTDRFDISDAKCAADRFVSNAECFCDLRNGGSRGCESFGLIQIPSYLRMGQRMIAGGKNIQIGWIIVLFVLVFVVDVFFSGYLPASSLFCHDAVGVLSLAVHLGGAVFAGGVGFAISQLAFLIAKHPGVPSLSIFGGYRPAPIAGVLYDHMKLHQVGDVITTWQPSCEVTKVVQ